jgi:hypothetical protein
VELIRDETHYDLAGPLLPLPLRGPRGRRAATIADPLQEWIGGSVSEENGALYLSVGGMAIEAHLLPEGLRKLATLCRLAVNGQPLD